MHPPDQKKASLRHFLHSLKNDLGALQGYIELLARQPELGASSHEFLSKAKLALHHAFAGLRQISEEDGFLEKEDLLRPLRKPDPLAPLGLSGYETILIVEDDLSYRTMLKASLEGYHYTILPAATGDEALQIFQEKKEEIDLVLIDHYLPQKSGLEVCQILRKLSPRCRLVFLSGAQLDEEEQALFQSLQISAFLSKPMLTKELVTRLRLILDAPAS